MNIKKSISKAIKLGIIPLLIVSSIYSNRVLADVEEQKAFKSACSACHNGGIRGFISGAPKIGSDKAWKGRMTKGFEQAIDDVLNGSENHISMKKEKGLDETSVRAGLNYIVEKTKTLQAIK